MNCRNSGRSTTGQRPNEERRVNKRIAVLGILLGIMLQPVSSMAFTNSAVNMPAVNDGVRVGGPSSHLDLSPRHSIMMWMKLNSTSSRRVAFTKYGNSTNQTAYQFEYFSPVMRAEYGDAQRNDSSFAEWQTGTWYHVAFTHDGFLGKWYVNGELDSVTTNQVLHRNGTNYMFMGRMADSRFPWNGMLDEISIWTNVLSIGDVNYYKDRRLAGQEYGLVAYWNYDNSTAQDLTGNGNNGVFLGTATAQPERIAF